MERKRSDDIVSLDSWNEAISTPESESPKSLVDAFVMPGSEDTSSSRSHGKKRSGRKGHRSRSQGDRDRHMAKQADSLVLSPSKFLDEIQIASVVDFASFDAFNSDVRVPVERETLCQSRDQGPDSGFCSDLHQPENEFGKLKTTSGVGPVSVSVNNDDGRRSDRVSPETGIEEEQSRGVAHHRRRLKTSTGHQQCQKHNYQTHQCERCQQQQHQQRGKVMSQSWQTQPHQYHPNHHPHQRHHLAQHNRWMAHDRLSNVLQYPSTTTYPPSSRMTPHAGQSSAQNEEDVDQSEKMKNKIMSVWNNVRYGRFCKMHCH